MSSHLISKDEEEQFLRQFKQKGGLITSAGCIGKGKLSRMIDKT